MSLEKNHLDMQQLLQEINDWALELGFDQWGVSDLDLSQSEARLQAWLEKGFHGEMAYMAKHGKKRSQPAELIPGTVRVISVRLGYLMGNKNIKTLLKHKDKGYIARYALGRDYHKVLKKKLIKLAERIKERIGQHGYRAFVDSAPVLEKPIAVKAGLGWMGKHTVVINREAGSLFVLGEIYTDLPLPVSGEQSDDHCGHCKACINICPTQAIVAPYQLDARRCISYLTIEYKGVIDPQLRTAMGNRIFGCDDCQLICPWNRYAQPTHEPDFAPRAVFDQQKLLDLFQWSEADFLQRTEGSAIRRASYHGWLRNIAIALGNAPYDPQAVIALKEKLHIKQPVLLVHVVWALRRQLQHKKRTPKGALV